MSRSRKKNIEKLHNRSFLSIQNFLQNLLEESS
jgi:hypothetical protein